MKKSNFKILEDVGSFCLYQQGQEVLAMRSVTALRPTVCSEGSPWPWAPGEASLVPSHHGIAACAGQWQWGRLNHTEPPEKGLLSSCIQSVFLWGIGSSPSCYSKVSLLVCGVTRQFLGSAQHSSAQLQWALAQGCSHWLIVFRAMTWQQTLNVLRTWEGHRILADDLIDHTPSLPPCRLHFHT